MSLMLPSAAFRIFRTVASLLILFFPFIL
jgi:hypothetical protein